MKTNKADKHCIISIVIPSSGSKKRLDVLLKSLSRQTLSPEHFEVLLCLNPVIPSWLNFSQYRLNGEIAFSQTKNANKARNLGIESANGQIIIFIDDDCELHQANWLEEIIEYFENHPSADGVGGPYALEPEVKHGFSSRFYHEQALQWIRSSLYSRNRSLFLLGGNFAVQRRVIEAGVRFDESVAWGGTELSFFIEAFRKNFVFHYNENQKLTHHLKIGPMQLFKKLMLQARTQKRLKNDGLVLHKSITENHSGSIAYRLISTLQLLIFRDSWIRWPFYFMYTPFKLIDWPIFARYSAKLLSIAEIAREDQKSNAKTL